MDVPPDKQHSQRRHSLRWAPQYTQTQPPPPTVRNQAPTPHAYLYFIGQRVSGETYHVCIGQTCRTTFTRASRPLLPPRQNALHRNPTQRREERRSPDCFVKKTPRTSQLPRPRVEMTERTPHPSNTIIFLNPCVPHPALQGRTQRERNQLVRRRGQGDRRQVRWRADDCLASEVV